MAIPNVTLEQALKFIGKQRWFSQRSPEVQKKLAQIAKLRTFERYAACYSSSAPRSARMAAPKRNAPARKA